MRKTNKLFWFSLGLSLIYLTGCGTYMAGFVVLPDGSKIEDRKVIVYTDPWTDSVSIKNDGSFKIKKNVIVQNSYTLIAEDEEGNAGYVRGYKPKKGSNDNIVVRLAREIDGKDAVIEGGLREVQPTGPGEKIFKSSQ